MMMAPAVPTSMAIFEALRARDPVAARNAMRHHFQRLFEAMLQATESQALEDPPAHAAGS